MKFREWLQVDEARFRGMYRQFRSTFPDMPDYVARDLYHNRIAYSTRKQLFADQPHAAPTAGVLHHPYIRTPESEIPSDLPSHIFSQSNLAKVRWLPQPLLLSLTPDQFDDNTVDYFLLRRFGYKSDPKVRMDAQRNIIQQRLTGQQESGENEPVIVIWDGKKYILLEGWHRTMSRLLKGVPADQFQALQHNELDANQLPRWKPVLIQAYVGLTGDAAVPAVPVPTAKVPAA